MGVLDRMTYYKSFPLLMAHNPAILGLFGFSVEVAKRLLCLDIFCPQPAEANAGNPFAGTTDREVCAPPSGSRLYGGPYSGPFSGKGDYQPMYVQKAGIA